MSSMTRHSDHLTEQESSVDVSVRNPKRRKKHPRKIVQRVREDYDQQDVSNCSGTVLDGEILQSTKIEIKSEASSSDDEAMVIDVSDADGPSTPSDLGSESVGVNRPKAFRKECPALLPIFPPNSKNQWGNDPSRQRPLKHITIVQTSGIWQPPSVYDYEKEAAGILEHNEPPVNLYLSQDECASLLAPPDNPEVPPNAPILNVLRRKLKCLTKAVASPPVDDVEVDSDTTLRSFAVLDKLRGSKFKRLGIPLTNDEEPKTSLEAVSPRSMRKRQRKEVLPTSNNTESEMLPNNVTSSTTCSDKEYRRSVSPSPPNVVIIKSEPGTSEQISESFDMQESNRVESPLTVIVKTEPDTSEQSSENLRSTSPLPADSPVTEVTSESNNALLNVLHDTRQTCDNVVMEAGSLLLTSALASELRNQSSPYDGTLPTSSSIETEAVNVTQNSESRILSRMRERRRRPSQTINNAVMEAGTFLLNDALSSGPPDKHECLRKLLMEPPKIVNKKESSESVRLRVKKHLAKKKRMGLELRTTDLASAVIDGLLATNNLRMEPELEPSTSDDWVTGAEAALCSTRLEIADEPGEDEETYIPPIPSAAIFFKSEPPSDHVLCDTSSNKKPCSETSPTPAADLQSHDLTTVTIKEEFDPDDIIIKEEPVTEIDIVDTTIIKTENVDEDEFTRESRNEFHFEDELVSEPENELGYGDVNEGEFQSNVNENVTENSNGNETRNEYSPGAIEKENFRVRLQNLIEESRRERLGNRNSVGSIGKGKDAESKEFSGFSFDTCEQPEPYIVDTPTGITKQNRRVQTDISSAFQPDQLITFQQLTDEKLMFFTGVNKYKFAVLFNFIFPKSSPFIYQSLNDEDQLLLVLFMYKHRPTKEYLSNLFDIPEKKVSYILNTITTKFRKGLNDVVLWSGKRNKCSLAVIMECREFITNCLKSYCPNKEIRTF